MKKIFFIAISAIMLTSCATILNGVSQKLIVISKSNKEIKVLNENGIVIASGNGKVETKLIKKSKPFKGAHYTVKTNNETIKIYPKINIEAFAVGNSFVPPFLGFLVDGIDGAMFDLYANDATYDFDADGYDIINIKMK